MNNHRHFPKLFYLAVQILPLIFILCTTTPHQVPAAILLIPFVLLLGISYTIASFVRTFLSDESRERALGLKYLILPSIPTCLAVLASIGQMAMRDFLML